MTTLGINASTPSKDIGLVDFMNGVIINDEPFERADGTSGYLSTKIYIGTGYPTNTGTLVLEDADGQVMVYFGRSTGEIVVTRAKRVLTSGTFKGVLHTTDCTNLSWAGGY
jgi:hypothetical protein